MISTHILDTSLGSPAAGVSVELLMVEANGTTTHVASGKTDADGRIKALGPIHAILPAGNYRLHLEVAPYFQATHRVGFYHQVNIDFILGAEEQHYHVPLLLNPFGYSTYRGS